MRSKRETCIRYAFFILGLFITGVGIATTRHGDLGTTPISSVANVMSIRFTFMSFGMWLMLWNFLLIAGQIVVLRRDFKWINLLQVPLSFLFGWFTDIGTMIVRHIPTDRYAAKMAFVVVGTALLGLGIAIAVVADAILNSGEAFVKAIADVSGRDFANIKIFLDVTYVVMAVLLSLLLLRHIAGVREGTVLAAFGAGLFVKLWLWLFRRPLADLIARLSRT